MNHCHLFPRRVYAGGLQILTLIIKCQIISMADKCWLLVMPVKDAQGFQLPLNDAIKFIAIHARALC